MLKDLIARGVPVKVCGTCMARCRIYKNHPYFQGTEQSTMQALAEWVVSSEKVITFQASGRPSLLLGPRRAGFQSHASKA